MSRRRNIYDKSAPSRRPGSLAHELVVLAGVGVRGVVLLALGRVDDFIVIVARQLDDEMFGALREKFNARPSRAAVFLLSVLRGLRETRCEALVPWRLLFCT